jgi:predicted aldo/keto reductase-like oxidoreductase
MREPEHDDGQDPMGNRTFRTTFRHTDPFKPLYAKYATNLMSLTRRTLLLSAPALPLAAAPAAWNQPRPLGRTGLSVGRLGMGVEAVTDPDLIHRAADLGITYFHAFGNQEIVGRGIRPVRSRIVLAAGSDKPTRVEMLADLDQQLRAFDTPHIDLWYLTSKYRPEFITDDLVEGLRAAKAAGKIRACAIAGHGFGSVKARLKELRETIGAAMVVCNFATWEHPADLAAPPRTALPGGTRQDISEMHRDGLGIVAMKPLMGGLKYVPDTKKAWAQGLTDRSAALTAALKWALANPAIDVVPVQTPTRELLETNVRAAHSTFDDGERKLLAASFSQYGAEYCRMCYGCQGACRNGVAVPDVLRALMYAEGYGEPRRARAAFTALPASLRQVRCEDCSACTVECRTGADVRPRLLRARTLFG